MPVFLVRASAERLTVVKINDISPVARLGRNFPTQFVLFNPACCCYYQFSFLSRIHLITPHLTITINNILVMRYLTSYIYSDILVICHIKKRKRYGCFSVADVDTNGILVTPIKNRRFAQVATAHTGKSQENGEPPTSKFLILPLIS